MAKLREEIRRLSEDLIMEILSRLPVKSLLRIRFVCKLWFNLIKSPNFNHSSARLNCILIKSQKNFHGRNPPLALHSYESLDLITKLDTKTAIPQLDCRRLRVWGTCNGLLCFSDFEENILVWNPVIGEHRKLPRGSSSIFHYMAIGIGFDSITNDYKVVAFVLMSLDSSDDESDSDEEIVGVQIYNVRTNSFRELVLDHDLAYIRCDGVCVPPVNGALHWLASRSGEGDDFEQQLSILSFDMSTEAIGYIELPDDPLIKFVRSENFSFLTVSNESLALFVCTCANDEIQFVELWVMQEYGVAKSWTKQISIGPLTRIQRPLILWKNKSILLETSEGGLVSCALDTSKISDPLIHIIGGITEFMNYHESLVPVRWTL